MVMHVENPDSLILFSFNLLFLLHLLLHNNIYVLDLFTYKILKLWLFKYNLKKFCMTIPITEIMLPHIFKLEYKPK